MKQNKIDLEEFVKFPKIPRLMRECVITEKIDGSNAQIYITEDDQIIAGSRNRWITPQNDNFGFATWVENNKEDLLKLGVGRHYGEWWGQGIQRGYGLKEKRFSLFNTSRWNVGNPDLPKCVSVVPVLYEGDFSQDAIERCLDMLRVSGSEAVPGWNKPEGVVIYMSSSDSYFKVLLENDDLHKGQLRR